MYYYFCLSGVLLIFRLCNSLLVDYDVIRKWANEERVGRYEMNIDVCGY